MRSTATTTPGLFTIEAEEAHLTDLLDRYHSYGVSGPSYSRMLRLARRCARRRGLAVEDVLAGDTGGC